MSPTESAPQISQVVMPQAPPPPPMFGQQTMAKKKRPQSPMPTFLGSAMTPMQGQLGQATLLGAA